MTNLQQLREREKKFKKVQKRLRSKIRQAEVKEKVTRLTAFGHQMTELFVDDPTCSNSKRIAALCTRYLGNHSTDVIPSLESSEVGANVGDE